MPLAHPLDGGGAALLQRSFEDTARTLESDGAAYERTYAPFVWHAEALYGDVLAPLRIPRHPVLMVRFGLQGMRSTSAWARARFRDAPASALVAGCGAHSFLPLDAPFTAASSLMLGIAGHAVGWPCARGGSQRIADAMGACFAAFGGTTVTGHMITSMKDLPSARAYLFDVFPHALARIAGRLQGRLGPQRSDSLGERGNEAHGHGARRRHPRGNEASEASVARAEHSPKPFVLLAQQSVADASRGPAGAHTGWAYCHVPWGSTIDMTSAIEAQVERFAPGFGDCIIGRHTMSPADYEAYNRTTLAATSRAARPTSGSSSRAGRAPHPLRHTRAGHLHLFELDPPGGRRSRHVRLSRGAVFGKKTFLEEKRA